MYSNLKLCQSDVTGFGGCEDFQNNCDRCGKWYRYNWRRRRTRDKTCNLCVNQIKSTTNGLLPVTTALVTAAAVTAATTEVKAKESKQEMNYECASVSDDGSNCYIERRIWDSSLAMFQYGDTKDPPKKPVGIQEFTEQLFNQMKTEFAEELRNPQKACKIDFDWPKTDQLTKVDCLRAFNVMKQILLQELSICEEATGSDPLVLRRKFYLERRFRSLEREKIRRLKIYERQYKKEETKGGI